MKSTPKACFRKSMERNIGASLEVGVSLSQNRSALSTNWCWVAGKKAHIHLETNQKDTLRGVAGGTGPGRTTFNHPHREPSRPCKQLPLQRETPQSTEKRLV